jgi:hypothetical protein
LKDAFWMSNLNGQTTIDIATIAQWGPARHVNTRNGERNVRKAPIPEDYRALWAENKDALRAAGNTWDVDRSGPEPVFVGICWWTPVHADQGAAGQAVQEQSRAVDASIEVPAPEGLEYLGRINR